MAARDIIVIPALIFAIAIGLFVIYFAVTTSIAQIVAIPAVAESQAAVDAFQGTQNVTSRLDMVIFGTFMGLALAYIVFGWFIAGNPIFIFFYFIFVVVGVLVSAFLANTWETLSQNSVFISQVSAFPLTNTLLNSLPIYMAVIGILGMIVFFSRPLMMGGGDASGGTGL